MAAEKDISLGCTWAMQHAAIPEFSKGPRPCHTPWVTCSLSARLCNERLSVDKAGRHCLRVRMAAKRCDQSEGRNEGRDGYGEYEG